MPKTRLKIKNLHYNISNEELKVLPNVKVCCQTLFSAIGTLKRCGIEWDQFGRSKGLADVEFEKAEDAEKAIKDYNGACCTFAYRLQERSWME